MKKIISSLFLFLFIISAVNAKIWRVNNNAGIPSDFTTAQAAHDGAAAGDTLHFEPSTANYGNLTMNKKLVLVGEGAFLDQNPGNQVLNISSSLNNIVINNGADNSTIMVTASSLLLKNVMGVVIQRCYVFGEGNAFIIELQNASNTIIRNCFLRSGIGAYREGASTNVQIINNIIAGPINLTSGSYGLVLNNVTGITTSYEFRVHNSTFRNNITFSNIDLSGSVVENNLAAGTTLPSGSGNLNNVNMTNVFVNPAVLIDKNFILKAGSPAIGAGAGGIDAGSFSGPSPYKLSVQPNVPALYKLVAPAVVTGGTITVTISTKSNN